MASHGHNCLGLSWYSWLPTRVWALCNPTGEHVYIQGQRTGRLLVICVHIIYPCHLGCAASVLLHLVFVQHLPSRWCLLPRHPAVLPVPLSIGHPLIFPILYGSRSFLWPFSKLSSCLVTSCDSNDSKHLVHHRHKVGSAYRSLRVWEMRTEEVMSTEFQCRTMK